jgi:hypothetical protein
MVDLSLAQVIPVTNKPNQRFDCVLEFDDKSVTYQFDFRYNESGKIWMMTITDPTTNEIILDSIPVLGGIQSLSDLLYQHAYLLIGSAFVMNISNVPKDSPDDTDLGNDFVLLWGDTQV